MGHYTPAAVERAMKVQEVILQARAGKLKWIEAAEVLGIHPRTMRRWKRKMDQQGSPGLLDRRSRTPSARRVPGTEVDGILRLYREQYADYNVRHFHQEAREAGQLQRSYTFVKQVLQGAGLVRKRRARGRHRLRRERRASFGEMLHMDGSRHHWLALAPTEWQTLITVVDDATGQLLYAQLWPGETRVAVMTALRAVFREHGLPQELYTDRAGWAARTPHARNKPDERTPTQLQRALKELGIRHILAHSPQARGRSERANRTLQGRLVVELRRHGIRDLAAANRYLREHYCAKHNRAFARPPAEPAVGWVPLFEVDLDRHLCCAAERVVARDNTVVFGKTVLQIPKQAGRRSCAGMRVTVRHHLEGHFTVEAGPHRLGAYDASGALASPDPGVAGRRDRAPAAILRSRSRPKRHVITSTQPRTRRRPGSPKRTDHLSKSSGHFTC